MQNSHFHQNNLIDLKSRKHMGAVLRMMSLGMTPPPKPEKKPPGVKFRRGQGIRRYKLLRNDVRFVANSPVMEAGRLARQYLVDMGPLERRLFDKYRCNAKRGRKIRARKRMQKESRRKNRAA